METLSNTILTVITIMKKAGLFLAFVLVIAACGPKEGLDCHKRIPFNNTSEKNVYVDWRNSYPDSVPVYYGPSPLNNPYYTKIDANTNGKVQLAGRDCIEVLYEYKKYGKDTLMVYVYDEEILLHNNWKDVVYDYMVLQRYDLSLEDFRRLNWTLSFPPAENMKDIKMWPPYGTY